MPPFSRRSKKRRDGRRFPNPNLDRFDRYRRVPRAKHALERTTGRLTEWGTAEEWDSGVNLTWEQAGWGLQGEPLTSEEAEAQRKADYAEWIELAHKSSEEGKEAKRIKDETGLWPWEGEWHEVSGWPDPNAPPTGEVTPRYWGWGSPYADTWGPVEPGAWGTAPAAPPADDA
ncbi:hypothetical protein C8R47DRAFT_1210027 [Mycena vitilis]|nr:hypothetical protein C8R47DRAFT_1230832 [Mycena vitilis]KAJ6457187.1 hypothetical protein C8R47DRAFT_1227520 [Mycena vitilis]KAJ6504778.1 hypothetical protein C8R47DRAFT_1210027 [Mycena vitilis]